ncbi:MAG: KGG domain-containing protein [Pseudomonadota bacterium]
MRRPQEMSQETKTPRGFAAMSPEKRRAIARLGGQSIPPEKRSFSQSRELAAEAGARGGKSVSDDKRSFSMDRTLASRAGRKGGRKRLSEAAE